MKHKSKFTAFAFLMFLFILTTSCSKERTGDKGASGPAKGYATGKVTDSKGNAIPGAKILLDNTVLYDAYINGSTDKNGIYKIKMPTGSYGIWRAYASIRKEYNGRTYTLDLHPDNIISFNEEGAVCNFTWKVSGKAPDNDHSYYGGLITIGAGINSQIKGNENITLVLEPDGPLIDGSAGEMLYYKYGSENWNSKTNGILDVPIGRYKALAIYTYEGKDYLLYLKNRETDEDYKDIITFDFMPESRFQYKNAVTLEFHE